MSYKFIYSLNKIDEISQLIIDKIKTVKTIMLRGELGSCLLYTSDAADDQ